MNNIEIVQKAYQCFISRDIPGLLGLFSDDIGWKTPVVENAAYYGPRTGLVAVREFFALLDVNEDITDFLPKEFIAEKDKVVVLGARTSTVKPTGKTLSIDWVHIFTVNDEKITNFLEFFDNVAVARAFLKAANA